MRTFSILGLGAASVLALSLVDLGAAEAGHGGGGGGGHAGGGGHSFSAGGHFSGSFHAGGSVHVGGGAHFGYGFRGGYRGYAGYHGYRSYGGYGGYRGYGWYGGGVWIGGGYWGWPYSYGYYPESVPSYYGTTYYPIQGQSVYAAQVAAPAPRPQLPRFGIGLAAGSVSTDNPDGSSTHDSSDVAFLARFRLTPGLLVEGELGKTTYDSNERVDRRLGASLIYEVGAYNRLAPYVLAGGGVQQANVNGDYATDQTFAEIGVGLRFAITNHFHIAADIRAGERQSVSNDSTMTVLGTAERSIAPPTSNSGQDEDYTRGRLSAILYF